MLVLSKSSLLGVVFATYFRVGSYGLGGNPQGPGGPRASTGHNHLSAISSRPSNHGVLCFRLRARQGRGGVYALGKSVFSPIMERHLKSQMVMISCHGFLEVFEQVHMSLWYVQAVLKEDFLKCFSCYNYVPKMLTCMGATSNCHPGSRHCIYYLRRQRWYIGI